VAGHRVALSKVRPAVRPATSPAAEPPVALYVHVPFCVSVCPYCDFVVYGGSAARGPGNRIAAFSAALETEIRLRADVLDARFGTCRPALGSVYLGGGTPSLLPAEAVAALLALVRERFGIAADAEVTLEANPGPDERGDLAALRAAGVNRVSFGAQSMDAGELRRLGRRHAPQDVAEAVAEARAADVGSINVDLLYDVPGQSVGSLEASLATVLGLGPDHLSLYALTLDDPDAEGLTGALGDHLPTRAGARRWRAKTVLEQDEDRAAAQYVHATRLLAQAGFHGYEISNWARPNHESRHNLAYWRRRPYEAVGPGAHAFDGQTRRWNAARLDAWLGALTPAHRHPTLPPGGSEAVDERRAASEAAILALRLAEGVPAEAAEQPPLAAVAEWAVDRGLLESAPGRRLALTTRGRLLSNEVFARLV
jgi:putative oxygen-independent coproporphyrinogen III oxidase